jgi:uncharacterized protein (DUF2249 family)
MADITLDVREVPPPARHPKIFAALDGLQSGERVRLVNDHDPKPLYYQIMAERPGQFGWAYQEEGPERWVVLITREGA